MPGILAGVILRNEATTVWSVNIYRWVEKPLVQFHLAFWGKLRLEEER
jgi:hypothetical protein